MDSLSEVLQLRKEVSRLQHRVEYLETKLDLTTQELELAGHVVKEPTFPFLRLPREIRDQIYLYALVCTGHVNLMPRHREHPKPPIPGICLLNRQISVEANKILYSRNTIIFSVFEDIHDCLENIGITNKAHIRSIFIPFDCCTIKQRWDGMSHSVIASYWAEALLASGLKSLMKMDVLNRCNTSSTYSRYFASMDPALERMIKCLFQKDQEGTSRHLKLTGFDYDDRKKFPGDWRVTMRHITPDWIDDESDLADVIHTPPPDYLTMMKTLRVMCNYKQWV